MDQERQIRFLIPPFFLLLSAILGVYYHLDAVCAAPMAVFISFFSQKSLTDLAGALIAASIGSIALGFFVGTLSTVFLRALFLFLRCLLWLLCRIPIIRDWKLLLLALRRLQGTDYEVVVSDESFHRMRERFPIRDSKTFAADAFVSWKFYVAVSFDHGILFERSRGIHDWLARRWNAFNISIHSIFAVLFPPVVAWIFEIPTDWDKWKIWVYLISLTLLVNGAVAWRQTMKMLEFQARRASI
jgi:hypothetical protein